MRLRTLTISAIGPFAGEHTVDFDALAAGGLFLLEGPTGAGKSTIIDAIVFALYGKVASADASEDRLRSAYAADSVESVVDLTFEVAAGTYRVRRTPAYDRAKLRGAGTVRQQSTVKLWRVSADGGEELLATRLDEAGLELQRAVGLDRTQFVQTIVLPQGEFANFLRADPEDRRGLLQRIFGTAVYERLQQRLVELRREADREVEAARGTLAGAVARVAGAARWEGDEAAVAAALVDAPGDELVTELAAHVTSLDEAASSAESSAATARQCAADARVALDAELDVDRLVRLRASLLADREALAGREVEIETDRASASAARAAAAVRPFLTRAAAARAEASAVRKALDAQADVAPEPLHGLTGDGAALRSRRDGALREAVALERWVEVEAGLVASRQVLRAARAGVDDLRAQVVVDDAWLAGRGASRAEAVARLEESRASARTVDSLDAQVEACRVSAERVLELEAAQAELVAARDAIAPLAVDADRALDVETQLRRARIAGLAGELADGLADGDGCPVCGSVVHPHKAVLGVDHVPEERVSEAESARRAAEAALAEATTHVAVCAERVERITVEVGDTTAESAAAALTQAYAALEAARAAERSCPALESAVAAHDAETESRRAAREELLRRVASDEARAEALAQKLDADEAGVLEAAGEHPTVVARHSGLVALAAAAGDLADALAELAAAEEARAARDSDLAEALEQHRFADEEDAAAAWLAPEALAGLDRRVAQFDEDAAANVRALADPALATLAPDACADVDGARERERAARADADERSGAAVVARDRATAVAAAVVEAVAAARALERAHEQAGPVTRLAGLAAGTGGDNAHALTLATYVLQRRFEDVVAAANDRLLGMSDGRYELVRSDTKEDVSSRRRGLAMQVIDHRTEQRRDPRTLSGGETFYVSLCLALGMADVVTAEAGGIDLGTLFVDEGFGSLDPHTLDQVLVELGRLRAGGRIVGVVSHVEALKQAIADRVEVRHLPGGGSSLSVRAG